MSAEATSLVLFSSVCRFAVRSFPGDIEFLGIRVRGARGPTPWLGVEAQRRGEAKA